MSAVVISYDDAVHAIEIAAVSLTLFNAFAAGLVVALAVRDNIVQEKTWALIWERRLPVYLAVSILLSHAVFSAREFFEFGAIVSSESVTSPGCVAVNELSWWGERLSSVLS
jgi:hypothetical protein